MDEPWALNVLAAAPQGLHHSLITRRSHARLPQTAAEWAAPLHVTEVQRMDYSAVLRHMRGEKRQRQEQLWDLLEQFPRSPHDASYKGSVLPAADVDALRKARIIEPFHPGDVAPVLASAFTLVEEKHGALRRRFILWPKTLNSWLYKEGSYEPQLELCHDTFTAVHDECGGITDLTTSFFQIALPPALRSLFCLTDAHGNLYQLTVLPMGLCISPEIMQHVTATLVGHPDFARIPSIDVRVNVYIDNIQVTGTHLEVSRTLTAIKHRAAAWRISLNEEETVVSPHYTFAVVVYDHPGHAVKIGAKTHRKLQEDSTTALTMAQLERLLGRLWFATKVLALPVHRYWWLLKNVRRLFSQWSRGLIDGSSPANLSACARRQLILWHTAAVANSPRRIPRLPPSTAMFDVFTDATLTGWGAVCINRHTQHTTIVGSAWGTPAHNINAAELRAVTCAFSAAHPFPPVLKFFCTSTTLRPWRPFGEDLHAATHSTQRYATTSELYHIPSPQPISLPL